MLQESSKWDIITLFFVIKWCLWFVLCISFSVCLRYTSWPSHFIFWEIRKFCYFHKCIIFVYFLLIFPTRLPMDSNQILFTLVTSTADTALGQSKGLIQWCLCNDELKNDGYSMMVKQVCLSHPITLHFVSRCSQPVDKSGTLETKPGEFLSLQLKLVTISTCENKLDPEQELILTRPCLSGIPGYILNDLRVLEKFFILHFY